MGSYQAIQTLTDQPIVFKVLLSIPGIPLIMVLSRLQQLRALEYSVILIWSNCSWDDHGANLSVAEYDEWEPTIPNLPWENFVQPLVNMVGRVQQGSVDESTGLFRLAPTI